MKRKDIFNLVNGLNLVSNVNGCKFAYAVAKNKRLLSGEIESIKEGFKASSEYRKYESERIEICKEFCQTDLNGEYVLKNDSYQIRNKDKKLFDQKVNELQEKNKEVIAEKSKQDKKFEDFLKEDVSVELFKIKYSDLPEDVTAKQLENIFDIIED